MDDRDLSSSEQQLALVREAKERMTNRARSWLDNSKVRAALRRPALSDQEIKQAS